MHVDGEAEPVQQLRTQFALLRIHRADQHEPGLVRMGDAVALDVHPSHRRGVEQHVDQMIVQQVHLVDVEHATVCAGQQPGRKRMLAVAQHALQVQGADDAVFGCAQRHFDQTGAGPATRRGGQQRRQPTHRGRLGGPLLAADQRAADLGAHGAQQQREPQLVVADDGAERIRLHGSSASPEPGPPADDAGRVSA